MTLKKNLNSFDIYSPPESYRKILILVENCVSIKARKTLNTKKTSLLDRRKYTQVNLTFRPKKIYPSKASEIIDKCNRVFVMFMRNYRCNTLYISMYEFKRFGGVGCMQWKRKRFAFTKFARCTINNINFRRSRIFISK